jgi:hypothetical protein
MHTPRRRFGPRQAGPVELEQTGPAPKKMPARRAAAEAQNGECI